MKKLLVFGTLCLAMGMASCKTYCPAYNYNLGNVENPSVKEKVSVSASNETPATNRVNG
ncbi:hypothetical protein JAO76_11680 [Pontibacter sp. BT310]|jgi:hypothetical protein|uniref:Cell envelope biogenesis protein OmpA n=1 Tax=Pontibacter populi TaxID=890055 RepID=A0ABS6XCI3_9BACT|nr:MULTISPECIES: hypothetical protein [Pontibacter]MBJ6118859.1 hypothetical protein [Pontibacter sp. BT310]MBR0571287.1 hypothetical protein [Microvirga sp. STS03]MBW3365713.1 hypothetical protein [Pontibacter populi]